MLIGALMFLVHQALLTYIKIELTYSLINAYLFFQIFFTLVCVLIELVARKDNSNAGLFYIFTFVIKLLAFGVIYEDVLFSKDVPALSLRMSLLLPMILYIVAEAYYTIKIINPRSK